MARHGNKKALDEYLKNLEELKNVIIVAARS